MISRQQQNRLSDLGPDEIVLARRLHELVSDHPDFEVLCEPSPDIYCFRYVPNGFVERQKEPEVREMLNRLNQEIVEIVRGSGFTSVMTTSSGSCVTIQISTCPHRTPANAIDAMFESIARWGRLLNKKYSVRYEQLSEMEVQLCSSESHSSPTEVSAT